MTLSLIHSLYYVINIYSTTSYHLSLNAIDWNQAESFCQSHCNSNLASLHSTDDYLEGLNIIHRNPYINQRVWIGLNDMDHPEHWEWSDSSSFNFGNTINLTTGLIIEGSYPWRENEPNYIRAQNAVAYEVGADDSTANSGMWIDKLRRFTV